MKNNRKVIPFLTYLITVLCATIMIVSGIILYAKATPSFRLAEKEITDSFLYDAAGGSKQVNTFTTSTKASPGTSYHMSMTVSNKTPDDYAIQFYTRNCWVKVFADGRNIYEVQKNDIRGITKTPGSFWNIVSIPDWCKGKLLTIEVTPVLSGFSSLVKHVYAGTRVDIDRFFVKQRRFPLLICVIDLLLGLALIITGFLARTAKGAHPVFYLGILSVIISLYSLFATGIFDYIYYNHVLLSQAKQMLFMLMPFPAICYCMTENKVLPSMSRRIFEWIPLVSFFLLVLFHVTGVIDFAVSYVLTGVVSIMTIVVALYYTVNKFLQNRLLTHKSNMGFYLLLVFLAGMFVDVIHYLINPARDSSMLTRITLLIYLIYNISLLVSSARELLYIGMHSESLKETAYLDSLTGLGNRTLLNMDMELLESNLSHSPSLGIIQFDINFLKRVNDSLGHLAGDRLIKNAARAISESFSDYGKCYRFGGDEFVVILIGNAQEKYSFGIQTMEKVIERMNSSISREEAVSIAYGIAYYDEDLDSNLWKVQERADVIMYERKRKFKEKMNLKFTDSRI